MGLAWATAFPWRGSLLGPSGRPPRRSVGGESTLPKETKLPPSPKPRLKSIKPNLKADTEEHLRLPRYFISQKELNSEARTHTGQCGRVETRDGQKPGSSFPLCLPVSGRRPSRDPAARQPASSRRRERAGSSRLEKRQPAPGASSRHGRARSVEFGDRQTGVQRHLQ